MRKLSRCPACKKRAHSKPFERRIPVPPFTKNAIISTFIELLNKTPLDKITVKDIVDGCGVNRNTFYYYYKDIYALLDDIFRTETQKVIDQNADYESWQDGFLQATKFARENRKAVYHVYNSLSREKLENYLYEITENVMMRFINAKMPDNSVSEEDKRFLSDFYKYALVGMMLNWISHGMKEDADIVIPKLVKLCNGSIRLLFPDT